MLLLACDLESESSWDLDLRVDDCATKHRWSTIMPWKTSLRMRVKPLFHLETACLPPKVISDPAVYINKLTHAPMH